MADERGTKSGHVSWIKIVTNIFDDEKILLIETLPDGDALIVIWFKLLCLAGKQNNNGVFMIADRVPYTDEMFATVFRRPINTVRMALKTFEQFRMIEIIDDVVTIPNWEKHQNLDKLELAREATRKRVAKHREKQRQLAAGISNNCNVTGNVTDDVTSNVTDDVTGNVTVTASNADRQDKTRQDKRRRESESVCDVAANGEEKKTVSKKNTRHKFGHYGNVLLSDEDVAKLKSEFPNDWNERIERLSEYIATSGKAYKNHLAVIRKWAKDDENAKHSGSNGGNPGADAGSGVRPRFAGK